MNDRGRDELVESWAQIEADLRAALAAVVVSNEVRERVVEFLDHNELGLAFQWLVEAAASDGAAVSAAVIERLQRAAREMGLEDQAAWRRLIASERD